MVLAEELHFGRAAERLRFAQPALSRQIARLEAQLGVALFDRNAHGVTLTAAGQAFRPLAESSLQAAGDAAAAAVFAANGLTGHLSLAVGQGVLVLVGDLLRSFAEKYAGVQLDIVSVTDAAGLESLADGGVEAAIVFSDQHPPGGFEQTSAPILDVPVGIRISSSHPLARRDRINIDLLEGQRLIMFPRHAGPAQFDRIVELFGGLDRRGGVEEIALVGSARPEMMRGLDRSSFTVGPMALEKDGMGSGVVSREVVPAQDPGRLWLVWSEVLRRPLVELIDLVRSQWPAVHGRVDS